VFEHSDMQGAGDSL